MNSHKIHLTKSREEAFLMEMHCRRIFRQPDVCRIESGRVQGDPRVPAIYHNNGYYYCAVEFLDGDYPASPPSYDLSICRPVPRTMARARETMPGADSNG